MSNLLIKKIIINLKNEQFMKYINESIKNKIYNKLKISNLFVLNQTFKLQFIRMSNY